MNTILFQKYEVLSKLGAGGMGEVMLARDLHLNQLVAIKKTGDDSAMMEKELLKKLEHPGLPKIFDFFMNEEGVYLIMEYIEGISLRQYLDHHQKVPFLQATKWILQLADILKYLHNQHPEIIYRDLKPGNIMLRPDGALKLIDLGAAFRDGQSYQCAGTVGYSPKEQWNSKLANKTVDVYGLGAVFHEMMTGINPSKPPFIRRPAREYDQSIPSELDKIVRGCTEEDLVKRIQTVEQLEQALHNYQKANTQNKLLKLSIKLLFKLFLLIPAFLGIFYTVAPLIQGLPVTSFPFPYLQKPLLFGVLAFLIQIMITKYRNRRQFIKKHEKSIFLTEKQFSGLLLVLFMVLCGVTLSLLQNSLTQTVYAGAEDKKLWVEMRDSNNRKMLLKENTSYQAKDSVRLEVPVKQLPKGQVCIQLVAVGEDGEVSISRIFHVASP